MLLVVTLILVQIVNTSSSCTDCDGGDVTCVDGVCLPRCVYVTSSGDCLQCRDSRFYGKQCENVCPQTCLNSRCQLNNSRVECTEGCVAGKKGGNCGVDCPTSCRQCERYGDSCVGPCKSPQYYGDYCDKPCPSGCRDGCDKDTGECDNCMPGYRGRYCNVTCPMNCRDGCDRSTGKCDSCKSHFAGEYCDNCVTGYRDTYCNVTCHMNCRDGCDIDTGKCFECQSRFTGVYCNATCFSDCEDGCDRDTGECQRCKPGYKGTFCNETCHCEDRCNTDIRKCPMYSTASISSNAVGIVMMSLAAFFFLLFVAAIIWIRRKRLKRLMRPVYSMVSTTVTPQDKGNERKIQEWEIDNSVYVPATGIRSRPRVKPCTELKGDQSEHHMKQEFKALPKSKVQSSHCGRLDENILKNRYKDILPFDSTRVCLAVEEEEDSDYINASYIDGFRQKTQYIAAQGPTMDLIVDFWRMIWQGEVSKIVMLTNLVEGGNVKCEMYWPSCGIDYTTYGDVSVQCVEEKVFEHHTVRSLAVWKANCQTKRINQFHFTSWPAYGVPEEVTSLVDFYKVVKNTTTDEDGPTLVHCSAGVGRTGTFLALVYLIEQARYEGRACVYSCVHDIRFQRMKMVHTEEQYIFLYRVLMGALQTRGILPDNSVPVWLQCRLCWETDRQHPVVNGVFMVYNHLDRNQSNSNASLNAVPV